MPSSSHLTLLIFTSSLLFATSQSSPVASPSPDCTTLLFGAADCLTFIEQGSNLTVPDKACCPEFATLVNTNPICLCDLLKKGGNSFGIAIDFNKAMTLPSACKVQTPDPSLCSLINGGPTRAPTPSPKDGLPLPPNPKKAPLPPTSPSPSPKEAALPPTSTNPSPTEPAPSPTSGNPSPTEPALPPTSADSDNDAGTIGISITISVLALVATSAFSLNML